LDNIHEALVSTYFKDLF